jgi:hypothetical protein
VENVVAIATTMTVVAVLDRDAWDELTNVGTTSCGLIAQ